MGSIIDVVRLLTSLSDSEKHAIEYTQQVLEPHSQKKLIRFLKQKKVMLIPYTVPILNWTVSLFKSMKDDEQIVSFVEQVNNSLDKKIMDKAFTDFSKIALER